MKKNLFIFGVLIVIAFLVLGYFETSFLLAAAIAFIIFMAYLAIKR